ncbi:MAG TPA: D-arabinono-1,4-lactone oxidase [Mycobacteriales bacterium]|nr:D-arabinono-1,4-lactone oxidase [Mycobacteriales bacterium]
MTWQNWAGNQQADPVVVRPRDVAEVVDAVKSAPGRVKAIGSGHSFTAIGVPEGTQLVMDRLCEPLSADPSTGLVTVQAGMPLHALNRWLEQQGLAMTNLGDIEVQTISGALSTGTHGTGQGYGGIATQVRGLELVLADGSVVTCSATERPELFAAARISLGALGVVTSVTLQTVPLFALRADERPMPMPEVLDRFDELAAGSDHFELYWFPHTQGALTKHNTRIPLEEATTPLSPWRKRLDDDFLSNTVFGWGQALARVAPGTIRPVNRLSTKALSPRVYTDTSYKVFTSERRVRFCEMEYAIPRAAVVDVLRELDATIERSGMRISFPVEVRVAAADDITLSTASGRESAYIAVHMDHKTPHEDYFRLVESVMSGVEGRPHWGKLHYLDASVLRTRYPRFAEFVALRDELDPTGRFSNAYLDRVLGPAPA